MRLRPGPIAADALTIVPANEASSADLAAIFGVRGYPSACQCQSFKVGKQRWADIPVLERVARLRAQTHCGDPASTTTSGLVAFFEGEPVGWCAVEPRTAYARLQRMPLPWKGRDEERPTTRSGR
jgi:hypothetical protein